MVNAFDEDCDISGDFPYVIYNFFKVHQFPMCIHAWDKNIRFWQNHLPELVNNEEIINYCEEKHKEFLAKPIDGQCGKGVEKFKVTKKDSKHNEKNAEIARSCRELERLASNIKKLREKLSNIKTTNDQISNINKTKIKHIKELMLI